jgi:hypothetical protein
MASVYENAFLVISPVHASDSSTGCFSEQTSSVDERSPCYQHVTSDNNIVPIYLRSGVISHDGYDPTASFWGRLDDKFLLLCQSWTFQERLLARRTLPFTSEELVWECRTKSVYECMGLGGPEFEPYPLALPIKQFLMREIEGSHRDRFELWNRLRKPPREY